MDTVVKARIEAVRELRELGATHVRITGDCVEVVFGEGRRIEEPAAAPPANETPEEAAARADRTLFASAD